MMAIRARFESDQQKKIFWVKYPKEPIQFQAVISSIVFSGGRKYEVGTTHPSKTFGIMVMLIFGCGVVAIFGIVALRW